MGAAVVKKEETMKTVTIPNNMRPWRCIVNGVKYEYPGGTVQTVPDEVAALIAEWKRNQPPKRDPVREPVEKDYGSTEAFYIGADAQGVYRVNQAGEKKYMDENLPQVQTFADLKRIIRAGYAKVYFSVGDQITTDYLAADGKTYSAPWDVKHIDDTGVYFGMHYAIPEDMQFDAPEAIYYAETELAAGTYHISVGATFGDGWKAGQNIQFTLTQAVPAGGQVVIDFRTNNANDPTAGRAVTTYATIGAAEAIESTTTSSGTDGTSLGTIGEGNTPQKTNGNLNAISRAIYGSGRYSESAIRQWLNSDAAANAWWTPKNNWDRPPRAADLNRAGFLTRLPTDFVKILDYNDIVVALNTVEGFSTDRETVRDRIFLPSIENMYVTPQQADAETPAWDYYKALAQEAGLPGKFQQWQTYTILRHFNLTSANGNLAPVNVWLRSANRYYANYAWDVEFSGNVNYYTAYNALRGCPTCKIKTSD